MEAALGRRGVAFEFQRRGLVDVAGRVEAECAAGVHELFPAGGGQGDGVSGAAAGDVA